MGIKEPTNRGTNFGPLGISKFRMLLRFRNLAAHSKVDTFFSSLLHGQKVHLNISLILSDFVKKMYHFQITEKMSK